MKGLLRVVAIAAVIAGLWLVWPQPAPPRNLLLIGIDTLRPDHTSVYGYERPTTPNLEALAARGVRFGDAMSHAPWTLPSVATVFTGLYPSEHGARIPGESKDLTNDVPVRLGPVASLPRILAERGLRTQAFSANAFTGYGIDAHFEDFAYAHAGADWITEKGIEFLRDRSGRPFFLYLHYADPHEHHTLVPEPYRSRFHSKEVVDAIDGRDGVSYRFIHDNFGFALYDAQTAFADAQIGRILRELDQLDLAAQTLVVVFSDHGEEFWEHAEEHRRYGEDPRGYYGIGHGQSLYQELLSVVWIMAGGPLPEGVVVRGPVGLRDLPATVLDVMGLAEGATLPGTSLVEAARRGEARETEVFSESIAYGREKKALRIGRWKYIHSLPGGSDELYDLARDPGETSNLAEAEPERTARMRGRVLEIVAALPADAADAAPEISAETRRNLQALGYLAGDEAGSSPATDSD